MGGDGVERSGHVPEDPVDRGRLHPGGLAHGPGGDGFAPLRGQQLHDRLTESLEATQVALSPADLAAIEAAAPQEEVAGERYASFLMASLDSEPAAS